MTTIGYTPAMGRLVELFCQFDGVGPVTAERMAMQIMARPPQFAGDLAAAITAAKTTIGFCQRCFNLAEAGECSICQRARAGQRDRAKLLVVASAKDVIPVEKTGYDGVVHVLGGLISPMDGVGPDALHCEELITRVQEGRHREVILLLPPTQESDATEAYLAQRLSPLTQVTRVAIGLALGSEIGADTVSLERALEDRRPLNSAPPAPVERELVAPAR